MPRAVSLLAAFLVLTGCAGPTDLPPPETLDVVLEWKSYQFRAEEDPGAKEPRLVPFPIREWHVTFREDGTFRYAWRRVHPTEEPWRELTGTWEPSDNPSLLNPTWILTTDGEVQHVDNEIMSCGDMPMVFWGPVGYPGLSSATTPSWSFQAVDPETGRFTDAQWTRSDPRLRDD